MKAYRIESMDEPDNGPEGQPRERSSIPQHEASLVEGGLAEAEAETPAGHTAASARGERASSVARSAGIVSLAVMASRVLGLVREMIFAFFFGASSSFANDAFVIAFRVPNLLRDLFAEGALSSAFVPVFSDYLVNKNEREAFRLSSLVTTALILVLGVLVILGIVFTPQILSVFASGFREDPQKFDLTVRLTRIMMPFILLVALAAQSMGILNARDRFAVPALSSAFFNVGSIIGGIISAALLADPTLTDPVTAILNHPTEAIIGMAYGVLIGGFLQYAIQWPSLRRAGFRYRPVLSFNDPGLRRIFKLMGPAVIGAAAVQVNVLVNSNFASMVVNPATGQIDNGPVSWLNYAFRFMQFPIGVFGVAIATATLPRVSRSAAAKDMSGFRHTIASSVRLTFLLTIPSAVGLAVLGRPIIALIYERGPFNPIDTRHTADALAYYAIGLAGYSAIKILAPAFYALGDSRTPMTISLLSIVTNFVLNWMLVGILQERGLALSTSTVALLNFGLLYFLMRRRISGIEGRETAVAVFKILLASAVMGAICWLISGWIGDRAGDTFIARAANVFVSVGAGAGVFYAVARLLGIEDLKTALDAIVGRFFRGRGAQRSIDG
ncbi:MAG TPA: murein biosynthesis integral membrane protein MurJ [Blastocatellia bacterium]|nr:murein biosynthesis integral membrane protein MurJ [Blastocatellia bacterium]